MVAKKIGVGLGAWMVAACGGAHVSNYDYSKERDPRKHEYVIGFADSLRITVWRNAELSTDTFVRPDGTITMPLIGDLQAVHKTPTQLRDEISKRLATYVTDVSAVVTVALTNVSSYRFTVSGNVEGPGVFNSNYYVTVSEAIAQAGGPNRFASAENAVLIRPQPNGKNKHIPIDYELIRDGSHPEQDLVLMAGDTVYVP